MRLGTAVSREFVQENGVPQGGVLSVTLFIVKMNSIARSIPPSVQYSLYVDDLQISVSSCNLSICERRLQVAINNLLKWADENGFKFSPDKTVCVCYSRRRGISTNPTLHMCHSPIPVKTEHKFLGLIFDRTLSFTPHIKTLKFKCQKSLNVLKVLSHKTWGSDRLCLLRLYRSVVRSRLDYGSFIYGSARPSALKALDPVHHLGLRLATGAFRTSPVLSLYAEANELSLERRRFFFGFMYSLRIRSVVQHPARKAEEGTNYQRTFESKPSIIPPFVMRNRIMAESFGLDSNTPVTSIPQTVAPWDYNCICCDLSLTKLNKKDTPTEVWRQEFLELNKEHDNHFHYYTDGTKTELFVGCAMIGPSIRSVRRLNSTATIFTAELHGLLLAVDHIIQTNNSPSVIYTDSLSALRALTSLSTPTEKNIASLLGCCHNFVLK